MVIAASDAFGIIRWLILASERRYYRYPQRFVIFPHRSVSTSFALSSETLLIAYIYEFTKKSDNRLYGLRAKLTPRKHDMIMIAKRCPPLPG